MPINFKRKCIFVHIPKTGGSSILQQLNFKKSIYTLWADGVVLAKTMGTFVSCKDLQNHGRLQHLPAEMVREMRPDIYKKYYKFSVVRNPYTKMVSEYSWRNKFNPDFSKYSNEDHKINFEKYLLAVEKTKINTFREYSQYKYLYDSGGNLLVNYIIRFEDFENGCKNVFKKLGVEYDTILHVNKPKVSIDKNYILDEKNKERIYNFYKIDFDTFGYEK